MLVNKLRVITYPILYPLVLSNLDRYSSSSMFGVLLMILLEDTNTMLLSLITSVNLHGFTSLTHKSKVFQKL
jgi:hypothetical protein